MAGDESLQFAERLRRAMKARGLERRPAALARYLGLSPTSVGPWYNGVRLPDGASLLRLADKLNVSLDWLLRGVGPMEPVDADAYEAGARAAIAPLERALDEARALIEDVAESRFVPVPRPPPKPKG